MDLECAIATIGSFDSCGFPSRLRQRIEFVNDSFAATTDSNELNGIGQFIKLLKLFIGGEFAIKNQIVEGMVMMSMIEVNKFENNLVFSLMT